MENLENIQNIAESPESLDENTVTTADEVCATSNDPELGRLIAEAEQRGYLRGRNEQIEATVMRALDNPCQASADDSDDESCPGFLSHIRPDFWD